MDLPSLDATLLARLQFAFTISFHILFPAFTIGLAGFVATMHVLWARGGDPRHERLARFWTRVFAVSFAMGVVSGIPMSYQFGTNWSGYSTAVGNVVGPLIGYEALTAFFLEATFLGILLFGAGRVPRWLHVASAVLVALGTAGSAFWILAANSWMHTPAGFEIRDGVAWPLDWWAIVFNPSFPARLAHMVSAAYLTTAVVVLAVGARWWLAGRFVDEGRTMVRMGLAMVLVLAPLQLLLGDLHGLVTARHQPAKIAAIEAHWDGSEPAPLVLFGWPDEAAGRNRAQVAIPKLGSLIITHDPDGLFRGLLDFPPDERPPVLLPFLMFRIMVGIGLALIALAAWGGWLWARGRLFGAGPPPRRFLAVAGRAWPAGFVAIIAGWIVTEVGRQPWVVHGLLRTADAASPVGAATVAASLAAIVLVYAVVFGIGIRYVYRLIRRGPQSPRHEAARTPGGEPLLPPSGEALAGLPNRPLSAANEAVRDDARTGDADPARDRAR